MSLLGIYREHNLSPGKVREDAAILDATLVSAARLGYEVRDLSAEAVSDLTPRPACALSMAQSERVLRILGRWQKQGTRVINTAEAVRNCYRSRLMRLLTEARVPIPRGCLAARERVEEIVSLGFRAPFWLKRGDVHAMEAGDVVKVTSQGELRKALAHFSRRRIAEILVQEHVEGEVIKFYGVGTGAFFRAFGAGGDEEAAVEDRLAAIACRAAAATGLEVFGGDAVCTPGGDLVVVDVNDWPSFSRCCLPAAAGIAAHLAGGGEDGLHV